jgi:hypothetical protein
VVWIIAVVIIIMRDYDNYILQPADRLNWLYVTKKYIINGQWFLLFRFKHAKHNGQSQSKYLARLIVF